MAAEERRASGDPGRARPESRVRDRDRHTRPRSKEGPRVAKARDRTRILRRFTSPRPGSSAISPLPDQARHAPTLRANPYPEVTDPICRLPLPTLFYRLEALHLGDLLRIWVRAGATPPRGPLPDFQGPSGIPGHRRNCGALRVPNPISLREDSRELERSCRKENSFRGSRRRLRALLGYPDEPLVRARQTAVPLPGSGIGTGFPFARSTGRFQKFFPSP